MNWYNSQKENEKQELINRHNKIYMWLQNNYSHMDESDVFYLADLLNIIKKEVESL